MAERGFGAGNAVLPDAAGHCGYGSTGRISLLKLMAVNISSLYELLPNEKFFTLDNRSYYSVNYPIGGNTSFTDFSSTRKYLAAAIEKYNPLVCMRVGLPATLTGKPSLCYLQKGGNFNETIHPAAFMLLADLVMRLRVFLV